ncbi:MAG TPA: hypothetical protein VGR91_03510 [Stellaceae bacterium]|nr:hypothetical protein [Stellaceae bacterium]
MKSAGMLQLAPVLAAAALLLGMPGPAQAVTVRCVPDTLIDPSCQVGIPSGTPNAIQAAINDSASGDIIIVGPGIYQGNGSTSPVEIPNGTAVSLYGAQAGNQTGSDGRGGRSNESIIDATGAGGDGSAIVVRAQNVRIDGFTVQGATNGNASGIDLKGGSNGGGPASGAVIVNNILQDNSTGISVNSEGFNGPVQNVLIENNLIVSNNAGTPASSGDGLFTGGMQDVLIIGNIFKGNQTSDLGINSPNPAPNNTHDVTIVGNSSSKSATFAIFTGTANATVIGNDAEHLGRGASFPGAGDAAISIGPGNSNLSILGNRLAHGQGNIANGIDFTTLFGAGTSTGIIVSGNEVEDMPQVQITAGPSTLVNSRVEGNQVKGGAEGIALGAGDTGNLVTENSVQGTHQLSCVDASIGGGTLGTANTWFRNVALGKRSLPAGLCATSNGR